MAALVAVTTLLSACKGVGGGGGSTAPVKCPKPQTPTVSFTNDIQPIFNKSCAQAAACHSGSQSAQNLDLSPGQSYRAIVGVRAVQRPDLFLVPRNGKADLSYIVQKIEGTPGIGGVLMPQGCPGAPQQNALCLDANQIAAIRQWIIECAQP